MNIHCLITMEEELVKVCDYYYCQDDTDEDSMDSLMITNWPCSNVFEVVELKIVDTAQLNHLIVHWQKVPFYR